MVIVADVGTTAFYLLCGIQKWSFDHKKKIGKCKNNNTVRYISTTAFLSVGDTLQ